MEHFGDFHGAGFFKADEERQNLLMVKITTFFNQVIVFGSLVLAVWVVMVV